jgi:hypothetical protein
MTTNVPQDVIDDARAAKAELTYRCAYADMEICPCEAADSDNCHEQIVHGIKFTAKTWGKFAQLRAQRQQGAEPVAIVTVGANEHGPFSYRETPYGIDHLPDGETPLYSTPPQANAVVAAAYRKAADDVSKALAWMSSHACKDAQGYEYGICRVKFDNNGQPASVIWSNIDEVIAQMNSHQAKIQEAALNADRAKR